MLLKTTLMAAGLVISAATAASAQPVIVGPGPFYAPPFFGPPFFAAPAPVVVAPGPYYARPYAPYYGRPYYGRPYYDAGFAGGPGWW